MSSVTGPLMTIGVYVAGWFALISMSWRRSMYSRSVMQDVVAASSASEAAAAETWNSVFFDICLCSLVMSLSWVPAPRKG